MLKLEGFGVSFRRVALLEGLALLVGKGQRVGLIGESGAGKSLLLLAIAGLLPDGMKTAGTINFDDALLPATEVDRAKLRGNRIGLLFQDGTAALDPLRTIGAQFDEVLPRAGVEPKPTPATADLLTEVGVVPEAAGRLPSELSPADRRLVAIALALAAKPDLLLADDPTAGLDLIAQRRILDLVERHSSERGMALLLVSHDLKAIAKLTSRVIVLHQGRIVEMGDKPEIFGHPKHEATRALLAAGRYRTRTLMRTPIGGTLLDVRKVSRRYRARGGSLFRRRPPLLALDQISLTMRIGESLALIGPSGAGKSTLGKIVAGLERSTGGELEFDNQVYRGTDMPRAIRPAISFVFADPATSLDPRLTIGESIAEPLKLEEQRLMDELSARMVEVVTAVGLSGEMLRRPPQALSPGERQRAAIARALVTKPQLVVLDEPVARLDVTARGEVLVMLNRLRADFGLTFLLISRDLDTVKIVADRVAVMDRGRIIEIGTPGQILDQPQQPLTRALVAAQLPDVGIVPVF